MNSCTVLLIGLLLNLSGVQLSQVVHPTHEILLPLHWRHNDHDSVSNHQPHNCLLNRLFRCRSKKTSKPRVTGLCVRNSPGPVNSSHKGPVTRKKFPFDDVIMLGRSVFADGNLSVMSLRDLIRSRWYIWGFSNYKSTLHMFSQPLDTMICIWRLVCQNQVWRAGTSNYIQQYLWDVITCLCLLYALLAHIFSYIMTNQNKRIHVNT